MGNATDAAAPCEEVFLQVEELRSFFAFAQLPPHLQPSSQPFCELAEKLCSLPVWSFELVEALRNLLRAKDAAVRAQVLVESYRRTRAEQAGEQGGEHG